MTPSKEFPKNPQVGDCVIVVKKARCGCTYDIRCQWDGRMWAYVSDQWCKPHGSHGRLVEVKADDGKPRAAAPENPLVKILDYERDTNGGRVPLDVMRALTSRI